MIPSITYIAIATFTILMITGPLIGLWTARQQKKSAEVEDNSLRFGTLLTGLSASAAGNSAFIMVGAVGFGYTMGAYALCLPLGFFIGDILFWYFAAEKLIQRYQNTGVETISELVGHQSLNFNGLVLRVTALIVIIVVGLYCVAQFLAVSKVFIEFTGLSPILAYGIAVCAGLASVALGGLGSSIIVNVYQAALMAITMVIVVVTLTFTIFMGDSTLSADADIIASLNPFNEHSVMSVLILVGSFIFMGFLYAMTNPHVLVRITKGNIDEIPKVRWVYMGFIQILWWVMTIVGIVLAMTGMSVDDPDRTILIFSDSSLAPFFMGFVFAGIGAASMSTGESQLLVIANALTKDIFPSWYSRLEKKSHKTVDIAGRIFVAGGIFLALTLVDTDTVGHLVIQAASLVTAVFGIPVLLFIFDRKIDGRVMASMIICSAIVTSVVRSAEIMTGGQEIPAGLAVGLIVLSFSRFVKGNRT